MSEERLPQPDTDEIELVTVLHALGDPVRMQLLGIYADGEEHTCDPRALGLERLHKSTVSHHMRVLRGAGITSTRVAGRNRYIRLRRADLDARFPGLMEALLNALARDGAPPHQERDGAPSAAEGASAEGASGTDAPGEGRG